MTTPTSLLSQKDIAIIGCGPGGLMCAKLLVQFGFTNVTIYEADPSADYRNQGGSLDLKEDSGQYAMKLAGLHDKFLALSRPEGQHLKLADQDGSTLFTFEGSSDRDMYNPEIDRNDLRKILLDSVDPQIIQWNHKLLKVEIEKDKKILYFEGGKQVICDLVVGADGAWSKVRKLLTPVVPDYSGLSMVDMVVKDYDNTHLTSIFSKGLLFALSKNKGILVQRNGYGIVRIYATMRIQESWQKDTPIAKGVDAKKLTLEQFEGWDDSLLDFVRLADEQSMVVRGIYQVPVDIDYELQPGVVLIGDAAHVMSPFAGEGVNMALMDAAVLAEELRKQDNMEIALKLYQANMKERSRPSMERSAANLNRFFNDNAPHTALPVFKWAAGQ
ncbi:hypothetical protein HDV06_000778 [Boothiomyces sp. JEL0866]|nr:hypothetical protein HDV06_000778 [Boothiomyces sp. JEL0866]